MRLFANRLQAHFNCRSLLKADQKLSFPIWWPPSFGFRIMSSRLPLYNLWRSLSYPPTNSVLLALSLNVSSFLLYLPWSSTFNPTSVDHFCFSALSLLWENVLQWGSISHVLFQTASVLVQLYQAWATWHVWKGLLRLIVLQSHTVYLNLYGDIKLY